jgi:hypothetical protein
MTQKAPTLAWLLAALTCFLAGMAVTEGRHQAVTLTVLDPGRIVVTVEVVDAPTATPDFVLLPTRSPPPDTAPPWLDRLVP